MRGARERGEVLDAAHAPAALHLARRGAEGRLARRGGAVGLRERLGEDGAVRDDALVDPRAAALVQRAVLGRHGQVVRDLARPQHAAGVHVEGERGGAAPAAQLGGHERVGRVVGAEAAVALRDGEGEQAGLAEVGVVLEGERRLAIVAMGARGEAVAAQRADQLDEALLLLAQRRVHARRKTRSRSPAPADLKGEPQPQARGADSGMGTSGARAGNALTRGRPGARRRRRRPRRRGSPCSGAAGGRSGPASVAPPPRWRPSSRGSCPRRRGARCR